VVAWPRTPTITALTARVLKPRAEGLFWTIGRRLGDAPSSPSALSRPFQPSHGRVEATQARNGPGGWEAPRRSSRRPAFPIQKAGDAEDRMQLNRFALPLGLGGAGVLRRSYENGPPGP
jgi:hypothetical protein